ncbi:MAG: hypothetical protein M1383_06280 [Patescibacteria group bacterium]|nr:hypothetical protein [Patescibacteria group bacterium]
MADIRNTLTTKQSAIDTSLQRVLDYFTPTAEETSAATNVAKLKGEAAQIQEDTQNTIAQEGQNPVLTAVNTAKQYETQRQGQYKLNSKNIELQTALDVLGNLQTSRQAKLDAAKFVYDASKNDLADTINIYKALAPESIGTQVDQVTGNVYVMTKNPLTGQVTTQKAGNIGPSKTYQSTKIDVDENTGDTVFYGVKPDGSIETKILSKGTGPTNIQYTTQDVGGRVVRFGFDKSGKMVSRQDLGSSSSGAGSMVSPMDLVAYAQQYASNGQIPTGLPKGTFGVVSDIAKSLPKPAGTLVNSNTGIAPDGISSTQKDGITALYDLQKKLDQAKGLFSQMSTGVLAGTFSWIHPSDTRQAYATLQGEITDLLARARTGAAITAYEEKQYSDKLPGWWNKTLWLGGEGENKIDNLKSSLAGKLDSTLKINGLSIYGYSKIKLSDGKEYTVGDVLSNAQGQQARVNPDGSLTPLN